MLAAISAPVLLSARDCSKLTGLSYDAILVAIHAGTLPAIKVKPNGKSWWIHQEDLDRFLAGETQNTQLIHSQKPHRS